jgi:hypothetical protein
MPGHRPVRRLRRPGGDVQDVRPDPAAVGQPGSLRSTHRPPRPQVAGQLVPQITAGLHEQRPVDRLVRHVHHRFGREPPPQPPGDLLRGPAQLQLVLHHAAQPRPAAQLRWLRPAPPRPRRPIRGNSPIAGSAAVRRDLPGHPRRRPTQPGRDHPQRLAGGQAAGDLLPLHQAQAQLPPPPRRRAHPTGPLEQIPHRAGMPAHLPRQHLHRPPRPPPPHLIDLRRRQRRPRHPPTTPSPHSPREIMKCCDDSLRPPR